MMYIYKKELILIMCERPGKKTDQLIRVGKSHLRNS